MDDKESEESKTSEATPPSTRINIDSIARSGSANFTRMKNEAAAQNPYLQAEKAKKIAEEAEARTKEAERLALIDPLTGLFNRRGFEYEVERKMMSYARAGTRGAFVTFDLDFFKKANDTKGHAFGDQILKEVAAGLEESIRPEDISARLGGEEFGVWIDNDSEDGTVVAAARIQEKINQRIKEKLGYDQTISVGVRIMPEDGSRIQKGTIFEQADKALYSAKETGRNKIRILKDSGIITTGVVTKLENGKSVVDYIDPTLPN